ncbi:hypothetical protein V1264_013297 [Littorina saxatilis]|uniref:Uncharacterized protein n=1 Tax=Littorina saxatilis TaxID=31220 RepID=A0AAN9BPY1_9CAEN
MAEAGGFRAAVLSDSFRSPGTHLCSSHQLTFAWYTSTAMALDGGMQPCVFLTQDEGSNLESLCQSEGLS